MVKWKVFYKTSWAKKERTSSNLIAKKTEKVQKCPENILTYWRNSNFWNIVNMIVSLLMIESNLDTIFEATYKLRLVVVWEVLSYYILESLQGIRHITWTASFIFPPYIYGWATNHRIGFRRNVLVVLISLLADQLCRQFLIFDPSQRLDNFFLSTLSNGKKVILRPFQYSDLCTILLTHDELCSVVGKCTLTMVNLLVCHFLKFSEW